MYSDPEHYPDPHVFNPDRFTEEERKKRSKVLYLPFGEGPRMCNVHGHAFWPHDSEGGRYDNCT